MDLEFLNSLTAQTKASESTSFGPHPCGRFSGTVVDVVQKTVNDKPVWELFVKTSQGTVNHNRWGFSGDDLNNAKSSEAEMKRIIDNISRMKRLFVDLKLWSPSEADTKTWNDILGSFVSCKGKTCEVVVKPNYKREGQVISYINEDRGLPDLVDDIQPSRSLDHLSRNPNIQHKTADTGQRLPAGMNSNLNNIPF